MPDPVLVSSGIPNLLPMVGRSPGIHVSDVIHDICIKRGLYKPSPANMTRLQLGCALEHALISRYAAQFPDEYFQPGELNDGDGLPGTPDLAYAKLIRPEEVKFTWISAKWDILDPDKFAKFWWQVGYYCKLLGSDLSRLHLCHAQGDYSGSGPIYNVWERRWSKKEITENSDRLLRHRDSMLAGRSASLERFTEIITP